MLYRFFKLFYGPLAFLYRPLISLIFGKKWIIWQINALKFAPKGLSLEIGTAGWLSKIDVAIDLSFSMLKYAKKSKTYFIQAKAEALPFKENSFSLIFSGFPTAFIFKSEFWDEIKRVLRKEGKFICLPWVKMPYGSLYYHIQKIIYGKEEFDFTPLISLAKKRGFKVEVNAITDSFKNTIYVLVAHLFTNSSNSSSFKTSSIQISKNLLLKEGESTFLEA